MSNSSNKSPGRIIGFAGYAENSSTGRPAVVLVVDHPDRAVMMAAAAFILTEVNHAIEGAINTITGAVEQAKAELGESNLTPEVLSEAESILRRTNPAFARAAGGAGKPEDGPADPSPLAFGGGKPTVH